MDNVSLAFPSEAGSELAREIIINISYAGIFLPCRDNFKDILNANWGFFLNMQKKSIDLLCWANLIIMENISSPRQNPRSQQATLLARRMLFNVNAQVILFSNGICGRISA